ncbi:glycosyltransferase [endosymbiont of unidentified scaly snail isolate Monju]|uniref:glycosyltransferase n=1 Tax=endosymbiont of unidentified scaly snail isolate Monju TaxID=1248727 RepID=UPI00038925F0|nr:glycosyltransferase [endosymbiont of unidentified scaly snail isolate Monju]BAN69253.1 glycosyl transferase Alg8 [endosymbiont of unidentified scaly snail isolate Monju]
MPTRSPVLFRINRRIGNTEGFYSLIVPAIVYLSLAVAILYAMWPYFYHIKNETFIVLGIFASWRYGWAITHYIRAVIYEFFRYPRLRRLTHDLPPDQRYPSHIFFIIPSYREEAWVTLEAIHSLFSNLAEIEITATFIVATGSDEDDKAVYAAYKAHPYHHNVELVLQRQKQGKRIAMGHALRALARRYDGDYNSVTIFMDGDSYLPPRSLAIALPFFTRFRDLGAATTNEAAFINTRSLLYKEWFNLKFGQRHLLFKSHALSNKVLTLTGRFSMFRTAIIAQEDFIQQIENDYLDHWMHGRFRFLMGDGKSTWFYLLKHGWNMLYLHDVIAYSLESRDDSFLKISMSLPYRWYGNTLRNNLRALKLGWRRTGLFIWWCIFDQRINMWTGLAGITGATILSLSKSFIYLPFYIAWVLIVKTLQTSVIALRGHPVSLLTIPLMLYNQWIGSLIKIKASFHLADQSWSKGGQKQSSQQDHIAVPHPLPPLMPDLTMLVSVLLFFYVMLLAEGALELPRWPHARAFAAGNHVEIDLTLYGVVADDGKDDSAAIRRVLD